MKAEYSPYLILEERGSEVIPKTERAELARRYQKKHIHSETITSDIRTLFQKQLKEMGERSNAICLIKI